MKELSVEEKAKAYDNVREKIAIRFGSNVAEEIFSEYEESEDERIRKLLIEAVIQVLQDQYCSNRGVSKEKVVAWLEKQGNNMGISEATKQKLEDSLNEALEKETPESWNKFLDEQGEQKPTEEYNITGIGSKNAQGKLGEMIKNINPVNEVLEQKPAEIIPKFKVGGFIVDNNSRGVCQVTEIRDDKYCLYPLYGEIMGYLRIIDVDNEYHLWTIQDAKDGDILTWDNGRYIILFKEIKGNIVAYCSYNTHSKHFGFSSNYDTQFDCILNFTLATKEQRDTLMKEMADAGYTFDFEKKELKKHKHTCELDNSYTCVKFPFKAKVKSSGTIVTIHGGQLGPNGKEWIKYQSDVEDGYKLYDPNNLELVCENEQKPVIEMKSAEESLGIDSDTYNKIVDECIYGEQKPAEDKGMNLVEEEMTPFQKKVFCIIDTSIEEEQGLKQVCDELLRLAHNEIMIKQKSAWSEEDERMYRGLHNLIYSTSYCDSRKEFSDFLNSLKDRVQIKPQQEWSEEDDDNIIMVEDRLSDYLDYTREDCTLTKHQKNSLKEEVIGYVNWLKSLKYKVQSQSQWKPSDEQMGVIEAVINNRSFQRRHLDSLYTDLKKLRGE